MVFNWVGYVRDIFFYPSYTIKLIKDSIIIKNLPNSYGRKN